MYNVKQPYEEIARFFGLSYKERTYHLEETLGYILLEMKL